MAGGGILCNEVLRTALNVLISLPPLSLSNGTKIPEVGVKTLKQVMDFLAQSSSANFTCDEEGILNNSLTEFYDHCICDQMLYL